MILGRKQVFNSNIEKCQVVHNIVMTIHAMIQGCLTIDSNVNTVDSNFMEGHLKKNYMCVYGIER